MSRSKLLLFSQRFVNIHQASRLTKESGSHHVKLFSDRSSHLNHVLSPRLDCIVQVRFVFLRYISSRFGSPSRLAGICHGSNHGLSFNINATRFGSIANQSGKVHERALFESSRIVKFCNDNIHDGTCVIQLRSNCNFLNVVTYCRLSGSTQLTALSLIQRSCK